MDHVFHPPPKVHIAANPPLHESTSDHVIYSPPPKVRRRGSGIRHKVQIPLCRHRLRWNFGPIK